MTLTRATGVFVCLILGATMCRAESPTDRDYQVYSALIEDLFVREDIRRVVVRKETKEFLDAEAAEHLLTVWGERHALTEDTVALFLDRAGRTDVLEPRLSTSVPSVLLERKTYDEIFSKGIAGWKDFFRKYPGSEGLITLSKAGINEEAGQALIYAETTCGPRCGLGRLVLLGREGNRWKVLDFIDIWAS